jgi:hypothetical protein
MDAIVRAVQDDQARVNITWGGQNGDLPDPVYFDSTDGDVRQWVTEAVRSGSVPGIPADPDADFRDFVVDRYSPNEQRPYNLIQIRPKTPFGTPACGVCGLDKPHADVADCMKDLMNYVVPEIRGTAKFQRVLTAGYTAMKAELARE